MSYIDDPRNKTGKILSMLIMKNGAPKIKGGELSMKFDMTEEAGEYVYYDTKGDKKRLHIRNLNVIFTPNGKACYHREIIKSEISNIIREAGVLMGINNLNLITLIKLFIKIDANVIKWTSNGPLTFFVPKEKKRQIIDCLKSLYTNNKPSYITGNKNTLEYELDYENMDISESQDDNSVALFVDFAIKNVEINGNRLSFREMNEVGLIAAINEEVREGEDLQMDVENCAYRVVSEDINFEIDDDWFLNAYTYLTSVDGVDVHLADEYSEQGLYKTIDAIAKNNGW